MRGRSPKPAERRSTEFAHSELRERILSGALRAGDVVSQAALAEELGVSRTPLREATRLLQNEGLLVGEPNRRLRVADASAEDLEQVYAQRIALEALALRTGAPAMSAAEKGRISGLVVQMEERALAGDHEGTDRAHREFHRLLVASAGMRFEQSSASLWDHTERYRAALINASEDPMEVMLTAHREHQAIAIAAERGDGEAAAHALTLHYERTARALLERMAPGAERPLLDAAVTAASPARRP